MKYKCDKCNYESHDKSNYNRHIKSAHHIHSISDAAGAADYAADKINNIQLNDSPIKIVEDAKFKCSLCSKTFAHRQSLARHKLKSCTKEKLKNADDKSELKEQVAILSTTVQEYKSIITKYEKLVELVSTNKTPTSNNNCHNTYNISVKNYIQKKYPNAPPLKAIMDYSGLAYKDYKLMDTLVYNYENKNLHKYLGDFIIGNYKKTDPSIQSIWSSDVSRFTYLVSEILQNNKSIWSHDQKATKIKELIIAPLLEFVRKCVDEFWDGIEVKKCSINDIQGIEEQHNYRNHVAKIASIIDNNVLIDDIIKYITPFFSVDKNNMIELPLINAGPDHFVDVE